MIGFDTNLLIRYIEEDEPTQLNLVAKLVNLLNEEQRGFISLVALAETVWFLGKREGATRESQVAGIQRLLGLEHVTLQSQDDVIEALELFESTNAEFSDCLIERCGQSSGCNRTMTFDRKASRVETFRLLTGASVEVLRMESHAS